jgi:hypothetical protein
VGTDPCRNRHAPAAAAAAQALAADEDDSFSAAAWADPRALKSHFAGVGSVRVPR